MKLYPLFMRIGIDARFFGPIGKGLGRYTQKLVENLEIIDHRNQYFIFLTRENFDAYRPRSKNFRKILADYQWYTFAEQLKFPKLLKKYRLDLVHFPHFNVPLLYRGAFVVTIHDLILMHFPTIKASALNPVFYWIKFLAYRIVISSAAKRAKKIIAVSCFTKKDILKKFPVDSKKIAITYEAPAEINYLSSQKEKNGGKILSKYDIIKPYLLYVGNAYPHKNLETLIFSFSEARKKYPDLRLVLVGKEDYFYRQLKKFAVQNSVAGVVFAGFVPDEDLGVVYRNALVYVFPSLYEGFGLPPLEAMACETPVLSSNHPCLKEILEEAAFYADAEKKDVFARGILAIIENYDLRAELKRRGCEQIKKYSWQRMARETLEIYNSGQIKTFQKISLKKSR